MDPTITQNGALFAAQHRPGKRNHVQNGCSQKAGPAEALSTVRAARGESAIQEPRASGPLGFIVGQVRRALRLSSTTETAAQAPENAWKEAGQT